MWRTLCILLVLLFLIVPASSQPRDTFRVQLRVSADTRIQVQVESYLARALQHLGDVQMTEGVHHWFLHILVIRLRPDQGYALSMVILESTTIALDHQAVYIPDLHAVYVDTDLSRLCARAVAAFDSTSLTPARAARRTQGQ